MQTLDRLRRVIPLLLIIGLLPALSARVEYAEELFPELVPMLQRASENGTESQLASLRKEERMGELDATLAQNRTKVHAYARVASAYEMREDIDDRFRGTLYGNVSLNKPLYQWGNMDRREAVAEDRVALEGVASAETSARYYMNIRRAYLQLLLMREQRVILEQSISLSESFVEARRKLVDVGQSSEQEVLEMEATLLENREGLAWAEKRIEDLGASLQRLIGPGFSEDQVSGQPLSVIQPMTLDQLDALIAEVNSSIGLTEGPTTKKFKVLEEIEDKQIEILDKNDWPTLDFVAGIYTDHLDTAGQDDFFLRVQYYAGLQLNWNIFDGWQTDAWKRSALARKRAYSLQAQAAKSENQRRAETLLAELQLNLKQIEARGKREDILSRRMELVREQAERALITGVERIEGEIDYLEVRQRLMEARVNYLINLMELGILLGQDPASVYYQDEA
ncbi:MAG: TolC family protein [Puniceicoccaceae bacterium]